MKIFLRSLLSCLALTAAATILVAATPAIRWQPWSPDAFATARKEHKLVILDLHAVWCHWCHVMEVKTYGDPKVKRLLKDHFVAIAVDQDSRPDLANRYEDYGWPATVIFDAQGRELAKYRGYVEAADLLDTLQKLVKDPNAELAAQQGSQTPTDDDTEPAPQKAAPPSSSDVGHFSASRLNELKAQLADFYDPMGKGWGEHHKFLQPEPAEYALLNAWRGDGEDKVRVQQTLTAAQKLLDPVWGGVYQYSVEGWDAPHFEKIMSMQATNMQLYSMAATIFPDSSKAYLQVARDVARYLQTFLRAPDGAFYTSQDADARPGEQAGKYFALGDAERRKQGMPKVDKHIYARDNGLAIIAHAAFYAAGGDDKALTVAQEAARAMVAQRSLPKTPGGYGHDARDAAGPYLADTLAMGRAHWALYVATGERKALQQARDAAAFIRKTFAGGPNVGFLTARADPKSVLPPVQNAEENLALARWTHAMFEATGDKTLAEMRDAALMMPQATTEQPGLGATLLLLHDAIAHPPLHLCIVGGKGDPAAAALYRAALAYPEPHKRLDWWDRAEGAMPNPDVQYPPADYAAAYICSGSRCGAPVVEEAALHAAIKKLTATQGEKTDD